jgi:hypothetical protein
MLPVLLTLIFSIPQEPKIIVCTYNKTHESVNCVQAVSKKKMIGVIFRLKDVDLTEWRLTAPTQDESVNSDAPLFEIDLADKQEVKAIIEGDRLIPVASCKVRVWRKLKDYTSNHPGDRVPFMLRTEPDDCQPWYGKN